MTAAEMRAFLGTGTQWNALVASLPGAHLLQTWEWAQVKATYGWEPMPMVWRASSSVESAMQVDAADKDPVVAAAMILRRPVLRRGFVRRLCILYVPKGPLLDPSNSSLRMQVLGDLEALGRRQGAILVKIDPDVELGRGYRGSRGTPTTSWVPPGGICWSEGDGGFRTRRSSSATASGSIFPGLKRRCWPA